VKEVSGKWGVWFVVVVVGVTWARKKR